MNRAQRPISMLRRAAVPAVVLLVIGNFATYAVAGDNGLLAWGGYHQQLKARQVELAALEAKRDQLKHRSALLSPQAADPDLADELVRRDLGLIGQDEVVLPLE